MKKLIGLTIILAVAVPCLAKYSGGAGTPENPYKIADCNDLYTLADDTNDYNKCFCLTADIDLDPNLPGRRSLTTALIAPDINTGYPFDGPPFAGTFEGNKCRILNLTIDSSDGNNAYFGLFGHTDDNSVISDLGVVDVNITATHNSYFLAGLVGENDGAITNCYATGSLAVGDNSSFLGGLIGQNHSVIENCYATCSLSGSNYSYFFGGLAGGNHIGSSISNCYATGSLIAGHNSCFLGGLVGDNYQGSITDSYAVGSLAGGDEIPIFGGLVGINWDGTINNCYFLDPNDGGGPDNGLGTSLTDGKMKQQSSFIDWDFNDVWAIVENVTYPFLQWENEAPIADAGPNQIAYTSLDGLAEVTLDANASWDPDGDPLEYSWTWVIDDDIYETNGVNPIIQLPVGQHTIELIVNDQYYDSEPNYVTVTVIPPIKANLRIVPRVLNLQSKGRYVLCFITLPEDYSVADIDRTSILLQDQIQPRRVFISEKSQVALAFFNRADLQAILHPGRVELLLTGRLNDGTLFEGTDTIWIIDPNLWRHRIRHRIR